jgi:predicted nucleic acid-binding protein
MILLDTNVISEAFKPQPYTPVLIWMDAQVQDTLFLSSFTVAELLFGMGTLQTGKRKDTRATRIKRLRDQFDGRILPFDTAAARRFADLAVQARTAGRGFPAPDGYIAAVAASHGFAVASRDRSAFTAAGLTVIDPWTSRVAR